MKDKFNREIEYMRISLTDRCNLRCKYCMPCDVPWIEHQQILSYEEILEICQIAVELGIDRFKITGGEPLVRKGCLEFVHTLKQMPGVKQVTMTTNGVLLRQYADELAEAGVNGINVSLDTLDRERFAFICYCRNRGNAHSRIDLICTADRSRGYVGREYLKAYASACSGIFALSGQYCSSSACIYIVGCAEYIIRTRYKSRAVYCNSNRR